MEMTSGEGRALAGRRASGPRRRVGPRPMIFFPMHLFAPDLVPDDVPTFKNDKDFSCPRKAKNFEKKIFRPAPMETTSGEGRALAGRRASGPGRRVGPRPVIFFPMHLFAPDLVPDDVFTLRNDKDFSCPRKAKNFKKKFFRPAPMEMTSGEGRALAGRRASGPRRRVGPRPVIFFPMHLFAPDLVDSELPLPPRLTIASAAPATTAKFLPSARCCRSRAAPASACCQAAARAQAYYHC